MGRKYASIHILNAPELAGEQQVRELYGKQDMSAEAWVQAQLEMIRRFDTLRPEGAKTSNMKVMESILREATADGVPNVLIERYGHFWSIFDSALSFENVIDVAERLSLRVRNPIVYVSNFDGDVFLMGVFVGGQPVVQHAIGEGLYEYDIEERRIDPKLFRRLFDFVNPGTLETFEKAQEISETEAAFSAMLGVPAFW